MTTILERFQNWLPWWLTADAGGNVAASLALLADDFTARAKLALVSRFPSYAPDDAALAAMGRDRLIVRGINEPSAAYAARLSRAFADHKTRGTPYTLLEQLRAYLQADCVVRTVDQAGNWFSIDADGNRSSSLNTGNWDWDGGAPNAWSRFWVIIYPVNGVTPWAIADNWGDAALWGSGVWGTAGATIGTTATVDQVAAVRSIIRNWKPANAVCEWVIVAFDAATFTPAGATNPAGEWAGWSNNTGGPVRLATARYWRGVSGT